MSTTFRAPRTGLRSITLAATLVVALAGGIATAHAQAAGGGNGGNNGGGPGAPGGGESSAVLRYGEPGNCPPTIACGPHQPQRVHRVRIVDPCGEYRHGGRLWVRCMREN